MTNAALPEFLPDPALLVLGSGQTVLASQSARELVARYGLPLDLAGLFGKDATALLVESALADAGSFECSDPLINRIHQANRWTYLGSGMTHASFLETLGRLAPEARAKVEAVAPAFL